MLVWLVKGTMSVKQIYNTIASEFDRTRRSPWPCVDRFISSCPTNISALDIGCGNGRHMAVRPTEIAWTGLDISESFVSICKQKGFDAQQGSMTALPFRDATFDASICIAAYHHLQTDTERAAALSEVWRVLKPGGHHFMTVWAIEQPADSKFKFTERDSYVPWKSPDGTTHQRYYRIYAAGELEAEIRRHEPRFKVQIVGIEAGNWYAMLTK
jgi:tRNA (uracil-5-)-methyltransferase TRM9